MTKDGQNAIVKMITEKILSAIERAELENKPMPWQRPWSTFGGSNSSFAEGSFRKAGVR